MRPGAALVFRAKAPGVCYACGTPVAPAGATGPHR